MPSFFSRTRRSRGYDNYARNYGYGYGSAYPGYGGGANRYYDYYNNYRHANNYDQSRLRNIGYAFDSTKPIVRSSLDNLYTICFSAQRFW